MSYDLGRDNSSSLGEVPIDAGSPLIAWMQAVKSRGNQTSLMPSQSGTAAGLLAEKVLASKIPAGQRPADSRSLLYGGFWYIPASDTNQRLYAQLGASYRAAIARNAFWEGLQPNALLKDAGKLAREGVSAIVGIPTWAIPVLLIGAGAYAFHVVLSSVGDGIRKL